MGGWHTYTMTEDIEFTTQCILRGERAMWVPQAVTYDEQPLTFAQSWKQRKRWSTGMIQGTALYLGPLVRRALTRKDPAAADHAVFFLMPVMTVLLVISALAGGIHWLAASPALLFPRTQVFFQLFFSLSTAILSAFAVVVLEKKLHPAIWKGIFFYWVYILSWIPINLLCLVKRTTTWEVIPHTRSLSFSRLNGRYKSVFVNGGNRSIAAFIACRCTLASLRKNINLKLKRFRPFKRSA